MAEAVAKLDASGQDLILWCVGCDSAHAVRIKGENAWEWDGRLDIPTLTPSLLIREIIGYQPQCHSFIRGGKWEYLSDCGHIYRGEVVNMLPTHRWPIR